MVLAVVFNLTATFCGVAFVFIDGTPLLSIGCIFYFLYFSALCIVGDDVVEVGRGTADLGVPFFDYEVFLSLALVFALCLYATADESKYQYDDEFLVHDLF